MAPAKSKSGAYIVELRQLLSTVKKENRIKFNEPLSQLHAQEILHEPYRRENYTVNHLPCSAFQGDKLAEDVLYSGECIRLPKDFMKDSLIAGLSEVRKKLFEDNYSSMSSDDDEGDDNPTSNQLGHSGSTLARKNASSIFLDESLPSDHSMTDDSDGNSLCFPQPDRVDSKQSLGGKSGSKKKSDHSMADDSDEDLLYVPSPVEESESRYQSKQTKKSLALFFTDEVRVKEAIDRRRRYLLNNKKMTKDEVEEDLRNYVKTLPAGVKRKFESREEMNKRQKEELEGSRLNSENVIRRHEEEREMMKMREQEAKRMTKSWVENAKVQTQSRMAKEDRRRFTCPFEVCSGVFAKIERHARQVHREVVNTEERLNIYKKQVMALHEKKVELVKARMEKANEKEMKILESEVEMYLRPAKRMIFEKRKEEESKKEKRVSQGYTPHQNITEVRKVKTEIRYKCEECSRKVTKVRQHVQRDKVHRHLNKEQQEELISNIKKNRVGTKHVETRERKKTVPSTRMIGELEQKIGATCRTSLGESFRKLMEKFDSSLRVSKKEPSKWKGLVARVLFSFDLNITESMLYHNFKQMFQEKEWFKYFGMKDKELGRSGQRKLLQSLIEFIQFCIDYSSLSKDLITLEECNTVIRNLKINRTEVLKKEKEERPDKAQKRVKSDKKFHQSLTMEMINNYEENSKVKEILEKVLSIKNEKDAIKIYSTAKLIKITRNVLLTALTLSTYRRAQEAIELTIGETLSALDMYKENGSVGLLKITILTHRTASSGQSAFYVVNNTVARAIESYIAFLWPLYSKSSKMNKNSKLFPNMYGQKLTYHKVKEMFIEGFMLAYPTCDGYPINTRLIRKRFIEHVNLNCPEKTGDAMRLLGYSSTVHHKYYDQTMGLERDLQVYSFFHKDVRKEQRDSIVFSSALERDENIPILNALKNVLHDFIKTDEEFRLRKGGGEDSGMTDEKLETEEDDAAVLDIFKKFINETEDPGQQETEEMDVGQEEAIRVDDVEKEDVMMISGEDMDVAAEVTVQTENDESEKTPPEVEELEAEMRRRNEDVVRQTFSEYRKRCRERKKKIDIDFYANKILPEDNIFKNMPLELRDFCSKL